MADVSVNSDVIADLVATPRVKSNALRHGYVDQRVAYVTWAAAASAPSLATILRVPAHARVSSIAISSLDFTTAGAIDVGAHLETSPGVAGAAIDADFFATAVDLSGGPYNNLDITNESTTNTPVKQSQPLWQALGVTAEPVPGTFYLITATVATTFNSTPTSVLFKVTMVGA